MASTDIALSMFLWPAGWLAIVVAVACAAGGFLAWLLFYVVLRLPPSVTPHPPIYAAVLVMFALILSFTISDAARRNEVAYAALLRESQEMVAVMPLLDSLQTAGRLQAVDARQALREYMATSLKEEWAQFNVVSSHAAGAALERARTAISVGLVEGGQTGPAWRAVMDRLDGVQQGRTSRLVAGGLYADALHWLTLYVLFLAGACALAAIHLDRDQSIRIAMPLYVVGADMALTLAALSEHPYTGWDAIRPDRIVEVLARFGG